MTMASSFDVSDSLCRCDRVNLDATQVARLIPHRAPFLFVESVEIIGACDIFGACRLEPYNPIFDGHFPGFPVVPGVLMVEAAAQVAGVLMAYQAQQRETSDTASAINPIGVLIGVKRASFHKPVLPGELLIYTVTIDNVVAGMVSAWAEAVGGAGQKVCKCELSIAIVEKSSLIARLQ